MNIDDTKAVDPEVLIERRSGVAVLTLNRPKLANSQGATFGTSLLTALEEVELDRSVSVVVLTGAGKVFCAGGRIGETMKVDDVDMELQLIMIRNVFRAVERIRNLELPVVAALNGPAIGGGAALALACDIVVAAEEGCYRFPFGMLGAAAADMGCAFLLQRMLGVARARHILLTGAEITSRQGLTDGLFIDVVKREEVLARAVQEAERIIAAGPRRAVALTKQILLRGESVDYSTSVASELYIQNYLLNSPEHKIRLQKFLDRK